MGFGFWVDDANGFQVPEVFPVRCTELEEEIRVWSGGERLETRVLDGNEGANCLEHIGGVKHFLF